MGSFELLCEDKSQQLGLFVEFTQQETLLTREGPVAVPDAGPSLRGLLVCECRFSEPAPGGRPQLIMLLLSVDGAEVLASKGWGPGELSLFEASKTNSPLQNGQV